MLPTSAANLLAFSSALAFVLAVIAALTATSSLIVRSTEIGSSAPLAASGGAVIVAVGMIAAEQQVAIFPPLAGYITQRAGVIILGWLAASWICRSLDTPEKATVAGRQHAPSTLGKPHWTWALSIVTGLLLILAGVEAIRAVGGWRSLAIALLAGPGLYYLILASGCALACWGGLSLERKGLAKPEPPVTNLQRDRMLIERWGGRTIAASGLGASLVCLQAAQSALTATAGALTVAGNMVAKPIGPFDLLTWLGTLGTLVVVIAGALVAMYVKRRDDESQHTSAVTVMRQEWINRSRSLLSELLALGERMRSELEAENPKPELAAEALSRLRAFELQLNPVEPMPRVLLMALRSWLHEAGLHELGRATPARRDSNLSDFEATTAWLVGLGQLVLKTEWAVTSVGRDRVTEKLWDTWNSLISYEQKYREEINRIAPDALHTRGMEASTILALVSSSGSPSAGSAGA